MSSASGDTLVAEEAPITGRSERSPFLAFLTDQESERIIREGLADALPDGFEIRRGGAKSAIAALQKIATPHVLMVDVSEEDEPLLLLSDLSEVVEPDVRVLVLGDRQDVNFYRQLIRVLGVAEYLYKPLTREMVARHFAAALGRSTAAESVQGGRLISITGVAGGVGATTIAVNLSSYLSEVARRHTLLLDADLYTGTAALQLGAPSNSGLKTALEAPDRIDGLFLERSAHVLTDRLHLLTGEEKLADRVSIKNGAGSTLLRMVRRRYNFVVMDVPFSPMALNRELLDTSQQRILVLEPTIVAIRATLRLLALPHGAQQVRRAVLVLNRLGQPGGLTRAQVEEALSSKVDIVLPYQPKLVANGSNLAEPAVRKQGGFRKGITALAQEIGSMPQAATRFKRQPFSFLKRRL